MCGKSTARAWLVGWGAVGAQLMGGRHSTDLLEPGILFSADRVFIVEAPLQPLRAMTIARNDMEELYTLILRSRSGDLGAFEEIVRRFQDMAYGYSYSILGDFYLAEDAAQEAFVDAYQQLSSLRDPRAFPGWFRRVVFKHCDRLTRRKRLDTCPLDDARASTLEYSDTADMVVEADERRQVLDAVRSLPEAQRTATTLFYINGYSQREIADFLEVPVTTVKKRIHDSKQRLRERMADLVSKSLKHHSLSSDFTDIVVRRAASLSDLKAASTFIDYHARRFPEHFESVGAAADAGIYVVGNEGEVTGAGYFGEATWSIGSTILRRACIDEIGGEGKGVPDPAFFMGCRAALKLAKERGINIAVVHGSQFDHGLCGFVPSFYYAVATLNADRARQVQTTAVVRVVRDADEAQAGREAFMSDPYATKGWGLVGPEPVTHVIEDDGEVVGYLAVRPDGNKVAREYGLPFGFMPTVTVRTRPAALAAIKLHGELAAQAGDKEIVVLQSHMTQITKTILSLGGRYVLRPSCDVVGLDAEMVAVTDFYGLTKELESEFRQRLGAGCDGVMPSRWSGCGSAEATVSLEVDGEIVSFSTAGGRLSIGQERQRCHVVLPRWAATRLYTGYYSGEELLSMGPLPVDQGGSEGQDDGASKVHTAVDVRLPEPEASLFAVLFPKLWPCSMPDPDVWPWVIGEPHPTYRHGDDEPLELRTKIDQLRLPWIGY